MAPETVLSKTGRGREEIETRAHGLTALQRRLLILIDGQRTVAAITQELGRAVGDPIVTHDLKLLESEHLIDEAGEVQSVA